jgi:hypothetical protein
MRLDKMKQSLFSIIIILLFVFQGCFIENRQKGDVIDNKNVLDDDVNSGRIIETTPTEPEYMNVDIWNELPYGAIEWHYLNYKQFHELLIEPSINKLRYFDNICVYFLPSEIEGHIARWSASDHVGKDIDYVRIGQYNFGEYYYNILSNKQTVSQIISPEVAVVDLLNVAVDEYETPSLQTKARESLPPPGTGPDACFYVHTTKGDYILNDEESYDENDNTVHNWRAEQIG